MRPFPRRTFTFPREDTLNGPAFRDTDAPLLDTLTRVFLPAFFVFRKNNPMRARVSHEWAGKE